MVCKSYADRVIGPITSFEDAYRIQPYLDSRPYEGLIEYNPQQCAGQITDPPVSVPRELNINVCFNVNQGLRKKC